MKLSTVVLMCGAPAVGKTTSCLYFKSSYAEKYKCIVHICFDHLFEQYQLYKGHSQFFPQDWKQCRDFMHLLTSTILFYVNHGRNTVDLPPFVADYVSNFVDLEKISDTCVLLLDDNFQYDSMREEYYRLCRKHGSYFCAIILTASLTTCLERNKSREYAVDEIILKEMNEKFEHLKHEKGFCMINTEESNTSQIASLIDQCIQSTISRSLPVYISQEELESMKEQSRLQNKENKVHQMDLRLRKKVGEMIKRFRNDANLSVDREYLVKAIGEERRKVLLEYSEDRIFDDPLELMERRCMERLFGTKQEH